MQSNNNALWQLWGKSAAWSLLVLGEVYGSFMDGKAGSPRQSGQWAIAMGSITQSQKVLCCL